MAPDIIAAVVSMEAALTEPRTTVLPSHAMAKRPAIEETDSDPPTAATVLTVDASQTLGEPPRVDPFVARYEDVRLLGAGGMGEVRLVHDRTLGRDVAMKILHHGADMSPAGRARFLAEIQLTAGLSHPGIVAVHDAGERADGKLWYTMPEVRGRTFRAVIEAAFRRPGEVSRRRLLDLFVRACEALAYAHGKGVVHRDIKPANIMIGEHGEVLVMDWGIARRACPPDTLAGQARTSAPLVTPERGLSTRPGSILGTPAYMSPEQARGESHRVGPAADVYALGALLLHILTGRPPEVGPRFWEPSPSLRAQLRSLDDDAQVPADLASICRHAMAEEPAQRYPDAAALAAELTAFLDGAQRREQALSVLAQAEAQATALSELRRRAAEKRAAARRELALVKPSDPLERKAPGWALEDKAEGLERALALGETEWIQLVHGALANDAALPEAHAALAEHYRSKLSDAELEGTTADAVRFEVLLRAHDDGRHAAFLRGDGALTLVTDPPGAEVTAQRYVLKQRRLVLTAPVRLGTTPLCDVPLSSGSYLLSLRAPGRAEVRYPVAIERAGRWDGRAPGDGEPYPIVLPLTGALSDDECYVPAGWSWIGGDAEASEALPRRRIWLDGFIMRRFPVTNQELIEELNAMVAYGISDTELGFVPGKPGLIETASALPSLIRDAGGRFALRPDAVVNSEPDAPPQPSWPTAIDGSLALACARFAAIRSNKPFRLPNELEREKAARGVDGRLFTWGDHADPAFAVVVESHRGDPLPQPVRGKAHDESAYAIRGLCGNIRDHCANLWRHDGPHVQEKRLVLEQASPEDDDFRSIKGGAWGSSIANARAAGRFAARPGVQRAFVGLRLVRSFGKR